MRPEAKITTSLDIAGLDGRRLQVTPAQLSDLRARVKGPVLQADAEDWDAAVRLWNGMISRTPALVIQPSSAHDVATVVSVAANRRLLLGIKGGWHHIAGTAIADGGLTLDMSRLRDIVVDRDAKIAHVGAGCRLQDVDRATQAHGLATVLGFVSVVGVAGLTLGGGLGYLTRRFGWTVDNLEEVEIVTADGHVRIANRRDHTDLFWAIRGGGGNFGVVTRFTFRLHEVGPTVFGGLIAWPFERADEILHAYREITTNAPRELSIWMECLFAPPAPFVPAPWHGRRICPMIVCYSGELSHTETVIAPIRALGKPVVNLLAEQPYTQLQSFFDDAHPTGYHYYWRTEYVAELHGDLLTTARELFADCPIPGAEVGFLHLGGALNDRAEADGAIGNREARFVFGANAMWEPDDPNGNSYRQWIRRAGERARHFSTGATYINFQTEDEDDRRIRATYGANFPRLIEIKKKYDPQNVFRVNRNISAE